MKLIYDPAKNAINIAKHGIDLSEAEWFDWETAAFALDLRKDYGEPRIIAVGNISRRSHVAVFTLRGDSARIISLRKANARDRRNNEKAS
ncbi:MAG: BrnT family toxin [Alphaproteobacteria bacterium]|nr:BrnT family toxin [Alphaproteobacteria bacterium]